MRSALLGILTAGIFALTASAWGAADPMSGYYGNILVRTNQPNYIIHVWFNKDGTFKQFKASKETDPPHAVGWEGTWSLRGGQVCMTYKPTPAPASLPAPTPGCSPIAEHKPGDTWTAAVADGPYKGSTETLTVTAGRSGAP